MSQTRKTKTVLKNMDVISTKAREAIRIGAYQGPSEMGDVETNGSNALKLLAEAHRRGVDFACMPECYLTGFGPPDVLRAAAISVQGHWFRNWVKRCAFGDMVSIVGFMERRGRLFHNSAAIVQRGRLLAIYRKSIPGSPHEKEIVTYVSRFPVYRAHGITFGVLICYEGTQVEPSRLLSERGARIIFEPHYSVIATDVVDWHRRRVRTHRAARAVENGVWYVKSNVTSPGHKEGDIECLGYGDSFILDDIGWPIAEAGLFTTRWITADISRRALAAKHESRIGWLPKATRVQMARLYR